MKKRLFFVLTFLIIFVSLFSIGSSADISDITSPIENAQEQFEDIPKTPADIKAEYLKQEWNKIILNNKYIGPIHKFFLDNSLPFNIVFNEQYSFSLIFILTLVFWFLTLRLVYSPSNKAFNTGLSWTLAIGIPIIFAHLFIYKIIIEKILYFVYSQETLWARTIVWFITVISIIVIIIIDEILSKKIEQNKKAKEKDRIETEVKEVKTFMSSLKEYLKIIKK